MPRCLFVLVLITLASPVTAQPGPIARRPPPPLPDDETYMEPKPDPLVHLPREEPIERELPPWRKYNGDAIDVASLGLFGVGMWGHMNHYELDVAPGWEEPGPLVGAGLKLDGSAALAGAGFRGMFQSDWGVRFALGFNALHADGFSLIHDELPEGVTAELDRVTLANFEVALGKGFDATYLYPYVDVKMGINIVLAQIDLRTDALGYMGSSTYIVPSFSLGPRAGLFIPLDGDWFVDVSGQYSFIGVERAAGFVGIGTWDD